VYVFVSTGGSVCAVASAHPFRDRGTGGPAEEHGIGMLLCGPDAVDRTTGAVRDVAAFVEVEPTVLLALLAIPEHSAGRDEPAVALVVHRGSRRAIAVGPFDSPTEARVWWASSINRLAANPAMACLVLLLTINPVAP